MAPNIKANLAGMTPKQKTTAIVLVITIIVIVWQLIDLFGGDSNSTEITPVVKTTQTQTTSTTQTQTSPPQPAARPVQAQKDWAPSESYALAEIQRKVEKEYMEKISQLQMLRVQREIEETNQAIASAKLATVTAQKGVSEILTKPSNVTVIPMTAPPVNTAGSSPEALPTPPPPPPVEEINYRVVSVVMQQGRWSGILSSQGKLYNIVIGDVLPDGSVISSINKFGVILRKDGTRKRLSMTSSL